MSKPYGRGLGRAMTTTKSWLISPRAIRPSSIEKRRSSSHAPRAPIKLCAMPLRSQCKMPPPYPRCSTISKYGAIADMTSFERTASEGSTAMIPARLGRTISHWYGPKSRVLTIRRSEPSNDPSATRSLSFRTMLLADSGVDRPGLVDGCPLTSFDVIGTTGTGE